MGFPDGVVVQYNKLRFVREIDLAIACIPPYSKDVLWDVEAA
jgi:hypothetical protein